MSGRFLREYHCPACHHSAIKGFAQTVEALQSAGMLRRVEHPEDALVLELLANSAERLICSECGQAGLQISDVHEEFDCPESKKCERCGADIPAERLEVFPDTTVCVQCQSAGEAGAVHNDAEYCPRCGGPMQLRQAGGSGLARYEMKCFTCGYS